MKSRHPDQWLYHHHQRQSTTESASRHPEHIDKSLVSTVCHSFIIIHFIREYFSGSCLQLVLWLTSSKFYDHTASLAFGHFQHLSNRLLLPIYRNSATLRKRNWCRPQLKSTSTRWFQLPNIEISIGQQSFVFLEPFLCNSLWVTPAWHGWWMWEQLSNDWASTNRK